MKIVEIFKSIQGEGSNFGKQVIFVRLGNCNLKCPWCDTDWKKYKELTTNTNQTPNFDAKKLTNAFFFF